MKITFTVILTQAHSKRNVFVFTRSSCILSDAVSVPNKESIDGRIQFHIFINIVPIDNIKIIVLKNFHYNKFSVQIYDIFG